ncbi:pantetheine-phosphate adenylyltransferase [Litorihabitans aurantiacus]|uniref:Phosphopantetheine adenylyltransferase n=1 Tax=Litorihabitans aurantiacus TaxID=1930061 RepID=A0AA37ULX3_9MICO|nr:pantetheine-phosphate adenylyltransferase [Litorihabitans aurantiacus]GMA30850.1 phosphopantetheine adenylyltransferase [Litorihabitans aurantiacus]
MRTAVVPGSFDPVTLGHLDVVARARALADEVVVAVGRNAGKTPLLTADERRDAIAEAVADLPGVRAEIIPGLLVDFCRDVATASGGDVFIVKGLRGGGDLDAEAPMAAMNRHLSGVETVFVVGAGHLNHIASSMVRDVARHGGAIDDLVPPGTADLVRARLELGEPR